MTAAKAAGHSSKHVSSRKHAGTSKHSPTAAKRGTAAKRAKVSAKGKHATHAKGRGFALASDLLPVCSLEAVAQSLRLLGQSVADDEVAWLWELCGSRVLSIPEALEAAVRFGLAGCRPALAAGEVRDLNALGGGFEGGVGELVGNGPDLLGSFGVVPQVLLDARVGLDDQPGWPPAGDALGARGLVGADGFGIRVAADEASHSLILGVDRPGPHVVLATADGWWSWGELYDPWPCHIEEIREVSWVGQ